MTMALIITNTTGTFDRADYRYELQINSDVVRAGTLRNIDRSQISYSELIVLAASQIIISGNPKPEPRDAE